MPFTPLPEIFIADLSRTGSSEVLELGSGDGAFTAVLRDQGVEPVTVDRGPAAAGIRARIRGDAMAPPLRGRFRVVVVANLLRHVWREIGGPGPGIWRDLVAPGGCLWVFEDEPLSKPPAARNYRDLQGLLARLDPSGRGPLLAHRRFEILRRSWNWSGSWTSGGEANAWSVAADGVAEWLAAGVTDVGGEVDRLASAIGSDGLSYGRYWWARWQTEDEA